MEANDCAQFHARASTSFDGPIGRGLFVFTDSAIIRPFDDRLKF